MKNGRLDCIDMWAHFQGKGKSTLCIAEDEHLKVNLYYCSER